jgi:ferrous iron transport protein A
MIKLADLKLGEQGIIDSFSDTEMSLKLMEMGCLPGEKISIERRAPLGDPIAISVSGYLLSVRKEEAKTILVHTQER